MLGAVVRSPGNAKFAAIRRHKPAVVLEMEPGSPGWRIIAVSVGDNAQEVAAELQKAVMEEKGSCTSMQQQQQQQQIDVTDVAPAGDRAVT